MAARKSCTHMTWSEAKSKSGDYDTSKKKKKSVIQVNHGQALTAKIVRKSSAPPEFSKAELRRAKKQEEKALALAVKLAEEREAERREREGRTVCPFDMAREQMTLEAKRRQQQQLQHESNITESDGCCLDLEQIAQCREMQLDEIAALDAIYTDTDEFLLSSHADVDGLRAKIDEWQEHGGGNNCDEALLSSIAQHPPLSFGLQLTIEDNNNTLNDGGLDLVATLLLQVVLPPLYPESSLPHITVAYFAVTDRSMQISANKSLESLVHLEEEGLVQELGEQAREIVPLPCIYELATTWLTDHIFEYCNLRTHAQLSA
mmetsp:Transcript_19409/g.42205  ORF Transcript_19409/g.42205 Transcript_19409/m.42205 type:complete len:318 (-) Transcript_19409:242-1195(-)